MRREGEGITKLTSIRLPIGAKTTTYSISFINQKIYIEKKLTIQRNQRQDIEEEERGERQREVKEVRAEWGVDRGEREKKFRSRQVEESKKE